MEALHARYPFLSAAREAVEAADVDLAEVATGDERVLERARERVATAIDEGTVGETRRSDRVELLSYPVARVLVSLVDEPGLTRQYARAEAGTARERFVADVEADAEYRSVARPALSLEALRSEFDLDARPDGEAFRVAVGDYLDLAADLGDGRWRLVNRGLADGLVPVGRTELYDLLEAAVRDRVEAGLPLSVPAPVAEALAPTVADLRERLADIDRDWEIDEVDPDCFPPCVDALLERVDAGEALSPRSEFTLVAFLAAIGVGTDEIAGRLAAAPDVGEESVRYRVARLREEDAAVYPPPSCAAVAAHGDCAYENEDLDDGLCPRVAHPLGYYERRLDGETPQRAESQ